VDLALIDMHLSGGTGYALVERLRQGNVRVVAISGSAELSAKSRSGVASAKTVQRAGVAGNSLSTDARRLV
jgi:CheY-like chemotaxis protein